MRTHLKTISAIAALVAVTGLAHADPVTLTWITTTSSGTNVPGSVVGETLTTTITVNNGGNSLLSQSWTAADFVSYRQEGASGWWIESTFVDAGSSFNSFTTDASGAVLTAGTWYGGYPNAAVTTSWSGAQLGGWWNNGNNQTICVIGPFECVFAENVQANLTGRSWTAALVADGNTVPEPASFGLAGLALVLAGVARKRRAA